MQGSSQTSSSMGSGGVFTGSFAAVDYAENLLNVYDKVVTDALNKQAKAEQRRLRKQASQSDTGWAEIAKNIKVKYNHEERQITYGVKGGATVQSKAMELEYGTPESPPVPMLRSSAIQNQFDVENNIDSYMRTEFMKGF